MDGCTHAVVVTQFMMGERTGMAHMKIETSGELQQCSHQGDCVSSAELLQGVESFKHTSLRKP